MSRIIGIDLGTTNSVVAVMEGQEPTVIPNADGNRVTPSVVAFTDKGRLVGLPAKRQAVTNPRRTVASVKRFMGRRHSEVSSEEKMVTYTITGAGDELVKIAIDGKEYTPVRIYTDAVTPNWDAMTAEEIAAVIESAPVVLGEWEDGDSGRLSVRNRRSTQRAVICAWVGDTGWWWRLYGGGPPPSGGSAPTREAAMAAADAAARERGWRLMGGE